MRSFDPIEKLAATTVQSAHGLGTLVFVNGFGETQEVWGDVASAFAADFDIVTFDHAGTGRAPAAAFSHHRYLNLRAYAQDLTELARTLKLREATVVGHSVGAMIALLACIAEPQAFGKLVMIGGTPRYLDEPGYRGGFTEGDLQRVYRAMMTDYPQWADAFAREVVGNADRPQLAENFALLLKRIDPKHALSALCAIFQSDHRADLACVRQPTLIVQSRYDPAVPIEVARYMQAHIASSRLVVMDADGHFPHVCAPQEMAKALDTFIRG
jgi:sigma-B regulation protein RsbQ